MWLGKSVLSRALASAKKQLESLYVSSFIRKKQSTHNPFYITVYIVLKSIIKNISYPRYVVAYLSLLLIKLILHKTLFYSLRETTTIQTIKTPKTRIPKRRIINVHLSFLSNFTNKLQNKYTKPITSTKTQRHIHRVS